jgi:hypothetical protein
MTFDRVRWLDDTIADADADPPPDVPHHKDILTVMAMKADEEGVLDVASFEQALNLAAGSLVAVWGDQIKLITPD